MDGILALSHFCESHGPCVIICTQRSQGEIHQSPHSLSVLCCDSCQSIDSDQALVSNDHNTFFVTTRVPVKQELAFLLKQATVRSLSCEEESCKGGILYFGDNERGHIISHTFSLQDSLARGFHRKYSILIFMKDKIHLLNSWPILTTHIKQIATELQEKAAKINDVEQFKCSQRAVRQAQGSPAQQARSLSQLTGEPAIFAHLHMWFTWLLSNERVVEKLNKLPNVKICCSPRLLKSLAKEMERNVFQIASYCVLTGIPLDVTDEDVLNAFRLLLPSSWSFPVTGQRAKLYHEETWKIRWPRCLPTKLPTLQTLAEEALRNEALPEDFLEPHLNSLTLQWFNIAKSLSWTTFPNSHLYEALGVQKCDLPLLAYWTSNCK